MGGYVALWLAHQYPSRLNSVITLGTKFDWSPESAQREIKKMDQEKIQVKIPAFARLLEHRHAPNDWKELLRKTIGMMFELGQHPLLVEKILSTINHQVKILLGDQDDMADRNYSETVAMWLPKGEFHLLNNTPHPIEKVDLQKIMEFVDW
jgi:pimeloyl-ACP methyl ester carboxylesterase